ncbi:uncharacterized protein MAM_04219 [Metarhizium album ARSEF 1941]|uniref:Uncharacterized protein n=1 Tax=Metarhizium album (strain ARSEF 1941) TaxID=1081103 RepID=A0A0B2WYB2_METAS|nr:uncharacterized protein MAM_04219 [Metarhizium album ARSEF 1941]KHN97830.1 hypothetical protein MAM_04219 [Metarhizium album ARSEF 1941]
MQKSTMPTPPSFKRDILNTNGGQYYAADGFPTISETVPNSPGRVGGTESLSQRRNHVALSPINTFAQVQQSQIHHSKREPFSGSDFLPEGQSSGRTLSGNGDGPGPGSNGYIASEKTEYTTYTTDLETPGQQVNKAILDMYKSWSNISGPDSRPEYPKRHQSLMKRPKRSQSTCAAPDLCRAPSPAPVEVITGVSRHEVPHNSNGMIEPSPQFSPLPLHFQGQSSSSTRRGEKIMIGQNGWLECTSKVDDDEKKPQVKRLGLFLNSIKKIAKDVVRIARKGVCITAWIN